MATIATRPEPARLSLVGASSQRNLNQPLPLDIKVEGWQSRMWDFYDLLGCVHYGIAFKRNAAAKVAYFAAEKDTDDPDNEPQLTTNTAVLAAVERLNSKFGALKEIVAELMVHINVLGEGYLVGQNGLEAEEWDVWSLEEVMNAKWASYFMEPDRATLTENGGVFAARIWRPHPRNRAKADAPLRAVAEQCEQLLLLEDSISAAAKSRLSAGLFYLPTELDIGDQNAFEDDFIDIITIPIRETDSAARYAPGLIRGPAEYYGKLGPITISREIDATFAAMREELVRAIAAGLDLPAEIILGKGDLNHWTGWEVDESAFRDHVDPDIILILDSITRGYLRPALVEAGVPNPENYLIWRDISDLGQKPPTIDEGIRLKEALIVNGEYVRTLIGAGDDDAPDEPEPPTEIEVEVPVPVAPGPPDRAETPVTPPALAASTGGGIWLTDTGRVTVTGNNSAVVAATKLRTLNQLAAVDRLLLERISEATEAAFNRVLERAGAKIRTHAKKDRAISATIERIPNDRVTYVLGERLVAQLQIGADELVPPDSFDQLGRRIRRLLASAATETENQLERLTGERPPDEPQKRETAIVAFLAALAAFATRLLFKPQQPEPGEVGDTVVPAGMVTDLMTQAGGATPAAGPQLVRGYATGNDSLEWLRRHGVRVAAHKWEYGDPSTRQQPFDPHEKLDGTEFENWEDPRLATPVSAQWLSVNHMFPGDHRGCRCLTVPVVAETAA